MMDGTHSGRRTIMQLAQLSAVIVALGMALAVAVLMWRGRVRRLNRENPEERYRRDVRGLRRGRRNRTIGGHSEDLWSAGAASSDSGHSRAKKAGAALTVGLTGGCGGCGGCGCGG
jgi:hypothetical protein